MRISDWSSDVCSSDLDVFLLMLFGARVTDVVNIERQRFRQIVETEQFQLRIISPFRLGLGQFSHSSYDTDRLTPNAPVTGATPWGGEYRSEAHTSELQALLLTSYAVLFLIHITHIQQ